MFENMDKKIEWFWDKFLMIILSPFWLFFKPVPAMKDPEKDFEDLTALDISRMIDAYLNDENEYFYNHAFNEYRDSRFENAFVERIRRKAEEIDERTFDGRPEDRCGNEAGRPELEALMKELETIGDKQPYNDL